ncbi:MAG: 1,4-alpha-glucan branching protein GlgB [Aestuariivita sp.]|nr:1,4-alpha-glucan branching protein GlgB [Aestuariivita sp.]MCY4201459.1 1,4-alpha-glucan branching protein GlgB [Aestuariivita sp.]
MTLTEEEVQQLISGQHADPFAVLGLHEEEGKQVIRVFRPDATSVHAVDKVDGSEICSLSKIPNAPGLFVGTPPSTLSNLSYDLRMSDGKNTWVDKDPYNFEPVLGELDEYLISEGSHSDLWRALGANVLDHQGYPGTHFAVWAPNARRVSVVGDFNGWDGRRHVMRKRGHTGVWEIFLPDLGEGAVYKFELLDRNGHLLPQKADPFGFGAEHPPRTASVIRCLDQFVWRDAAWIAERGTRQHINQPIAIYEVHLGSWRRVIEQDNRPLSYLEHAQELVDYIVDMGFTHLELLPISEFPFDGSWGYQPVGLYAPTVRFGTLDEFRQLVAACHAAEIGLIIDWVPAHFPTDSHGLSQFDGTALYEHQDRREGFHPDWNTLVYNYGRREVLNFLIANALYWMTEHHVDGLRVDAVASMLYRDYSRKAGEWIPNKDGGRENLEAISFLGQLNSATYGKTMGTMMIAEESTAFPSVTGRVDQGGLGFGYKWNMGWMNDTLSFIQKDPVHRNYHYDQMTFGLHYAFSENFILPISHDEVVHGKGSMITKMPGDPAEKYANLRAYYGFMWGHPGKKLLFMGCEFAQISEWVHELSLDWHLLDDNRHRGVQTLVRDLNRLYRTTPSLHQRDSDATGFLWVENEAADESILAWIRYGNYGSSPVLVVCNFTPVLRENWRVGVPISGEWTEILNTDAAVYGGANLGNSGRVDSEPVSHKQFEYSLRLTLPPLSAVFFEQRQS